MSGRSSVPHRPGAAGPRESSEQPPTRWLHAACEASDIDPFTFLAADFGPSTADQTRAYWRMGSRWSASRGALAEIDSRDWEGRDDLCEIVLQRAMELLGTPAVSRFERSSGEGMPDDGPRMYGGLAFRSRWGGLDPGETNGPWAEFPTARFFLPAYELEGEEGRVTLRAWRRLDGFTDPKPELEKARADLDRLRSRLARAGRGERRDREFEPSESPVEEIVTWPQWRESVGRVLDRIRLGDVQKVVLARAVDVRLAPQPDPIDGVEAISAGDPAANIFSFQFAPGAAFFGASPELLGSLRGGDFRTMAVAGSAPRGEDAEADESLGRALRHSPKDLLEHEICVRELRDRLDPLTTRLEVEATPRLRRLAAIQHLETVVTGDVAEGTHILDLLSVLHPTAAVCGRPRDSAARVLAAEEPVSRGWYAGAVGWFDGAGNGEFVPGLRCAVLAGQVLRLFAGAGIVEASRPKPEWEETSLKLRAIGRALGLGEVA